MGAEAVLDVMKSIDLKEMHASLQEGMRTTSGQRRKKAIKRLRVFEAFQKSGNKPEWMVFTVLPVLPPELRPMVQLDGGRFATSTMPSLWSTARTMIAVGTSRLLGAVGRSACVPAARAAHHSETGHAPHSGARGLPMVAPSSMSA